VLVYTQYRNDFHNDSKRRKKPTQCTCYKNTTKLHVSIATAVICTRLGLRLCLINELTRSAAQTETHSKILPSPTYMEITKNSIDLKAYSKSQTMDGNRWGLVICKLRTGMELPSL